MTHTITRENVSKLSSADHSLAFTIEGLEGFHVIRESTTLFLFDDSLVNRQELVELVLFLA